MATEWVTIRNPKLKDAPASRVTRKAFELVWKPKGFEEVKDSSTASSGKAKGGES